MNTDNVNIIRIENNTNKKYAKKINEIVLTDEINDPIIFQKNIIITPPNIFENINYKDSNIKKLLIYLQKINELNNDTRIVCHSGIMKKFIEKDLMIEDNRIENILDQNLWTIILNKHISISRHGYSIANIKKGSINQQLEKDAQLSVFGILTALYHSDYLSTKETIDNMTHPSKVYVSILIRTWMTAICLYLPKCKDTSFQLIISPFIKESGSLSSIKTLGILGKDNEPEDYETQINNILSFLSYLMEISAITFSKNEIKNNIIAIKNFFINNGILIIYTFKIMKKIMKKDSKKFIKVSIFYQNGKFMKQEEYENYFERNMNTNNNPLNIQSIEILKGEKKPEKEIKMSRWCEPFSKKNKFSRSEKKCILNKN